MSILCFNKLPKNNPFSHANAISSPSQYSSSPPYLRYLISQLHLNISTTKPPSLILNDLAICLAMGWLKVEMSSTIPASYPIKKLLSSNNNVLVGTLNRHIELCNWHLSLIKYSFKCQFESDIISDWPTRVAVRRKESPMSMERRSWKSSVEKILIVPSLHPITKMLSMSFSIAKLLLLADGFYDSWMLSNL